MTNENKYLRAFKKFRKFLYSKFFPTVTKSLTKMFPQYLRALLWRRICLKTLVKE